MSDRSTIEWTDATWNPVRGCTPVSAGCKNCYAARMASRFSGPGKPYEGLAKGGEWTGKIRLVQEALEQPLRWRKPRKIFVCSMSDLFHPSVSDAFIDEVFAVITICAMHEVPKGHTFQILTKRPERMRDYIRSLPERQNIIARAAGVLMEDGDGWLDCVAHRMPHPLPNVLLGISVENQETMDERWAAVRGVPAALLFFSLEPLLGPVKIPYEALMGPDAAGHVIVGGESGPGARPMHPQWARDIRDQCSAAGVPLMLKQLGEWVDVWDHPAAPDYAELDHGATVYPDGRVVWRVFEDTCANGATTMVRVGKKAAGRELDGREWLEMPPARAALNPPDREDDNAKV